MEFAIFDEEGDGGCGGDRLCEGGEVVDGGEGVADSSGAEAAVAVRLFPDNHSSSSDEDDAPRDFAGFDSIVNGIVDFGEECRVHADGFGRASAQLKRCTGRGGGDEEVEGEEDGSECPYAGREDEMRPDCGAGRVERRSFLNVSRDVFHGLAVLPLWSGRLGQLWREGRLAAREFRLEAWRAAC
jgi:hypothetical protein